MFPQLAKECLSELNMKLYDVVYLWSIIWIINKLFALYGT